MAKKLELRYKTFCVIFYYRKKTKDGRKKIEGLSIPVIPAIFKDDESFQYLIKNGFDVVEEE